MGYRINHSLFLRLALLILIGTSLVLFSVIIINRQIMRPLILEKQNQYYLTLASDSAHEIDLPLIAASEGVKELAAVFTVQDPNRGNVESALREMLAENPAMFGAAFALSPKEDFQQSGFQMVYGQYAGEEFLFSDRASPQQDYQSDWFYLPYYLKEPIWTEPYYDFDVEALMITYSVPVLKEGEVLGVVTCDLTLNYIQELLDNLDLGSQGSSVIFSRHGRLILHPNPAWSMNETLYSLRENSKSEEDRQTLSELSRLIKTQDSGSLHFKRIEGEDSAWIYYDTLNSCGWRISFIIHEEQILAPIGTLNRATFFVSLLGMVLLLIPAFVVSLTITRPLHDLCRATEELAGGNFDADLPAPKRKDEIGRLVESFEQMRLKLKEYVRNLAATTAEKERIASELNIARDIQHSILPKIFPPFPSRAGLDIYALLESAKEVGGDLYDFLLLDDDHLYICIGDVSGKGVPASLFMATGKTLLKSTIQTLQDPGQTLRHVNNELAEGNDSCMFITVFCGIFNLQSKTLTYANAGHNPPLIISRDSIEYLEHAPSPPLAALPGIEYENKTIFLEDGTRFLLYTDGVTEAMNRQNDQYGEDRLAAFFRNTPCRTAEKSISRLLQDVDRFVDGAEQSDDITMLCFSYVKGKDISSEPGSPTTSIVLNNHRAEIARMVNWLEEISSKLEWPPALLNQLNLVLEEWIINVISYAFPDGQVHEIELRLWQTDENIRIEIIDDGIAFDPTRRTKPDTSLPIEDREIGGLGIHFINNTMDEFTYQREEGHNIITLKKAR